MLEVDDSMTGNPDPISEFTVLSKSLWPSWVNDRLKMSVDHEKQEQLRLNIRLESSKAIQILAPLQPLPLACGRLRYEEFEIKSIDTTYGDPCAIFGYGLPGIEGHALAKTKFSFGIDIFRLEAFEGAAIPLSQHEPVKIKAGDRIGIGMCFECHSDETQLDCFFATLNGALIYESRCLGAIHRGFYSTTIYSPNTSMILSLNRGDQPFAFDVKGFQKKHASDHSFFRSYLPTSHHLFNLDGQTPFWTPQKISENFAFAIDYRPVAQNLQKSPNFQFYLEIASSQRQIYMWLKIYGLVVRYQEEHPNKDSLPQQLASQEAINATLSRLGFNSFLVDFNKPLLDVWNQILVGLTDLRYQSQVKLIYNAAERYKTRKMSIFEDEDEIRGGSFEGWLKQAIFLHESIGTLENDWVLFARDTTLEELVEADFHLQAACPGYLEEYLHEPHHEDHLDVIEDVPMPDTMLSEEIPESSFEAPEVEMDPEEEIKATKMIAIGSAMRAWAAWMGVFVENLESELCALEFGTVPQKHPLVPRDLTLNFASKLILRQYSNPTKKSDSKKPSPIWLWMQYMSLGFGPHPDINHIPSTIEEAIDGLERYFDAQCSNLSQTDISILETDLGHLLSSDSFHPDLLYLLHQTQLALGSKMSNQELGSRIIQILPNDVLSLIKLPESTIKSQVTEITPPTPPLPRRSTVNEPAQLENTKSSQATSQWFVIGAAGLAVASACAGALFAILISRKIASKK
jgi:hypothetical protein